MHCITLKKKITFEVLRINALPIWAKCFILKEWTCVVGLIKWSYLAFENKIKSEDKDLLCRSRCNKNQMDQNFFSDHKLANSRLNIEFENIHSCKVIYIYMNSSMVIWCTKWNVRPPKHLSQNNEGDKTCGQWRIIIFSQKFKLRSSLQIQNVFWKKSQGTTWTCFF